MSQATAAIANMSRTLFRAAVNAITQAIQSQNSGLTEPSETYPYMMWADTTTGLFKQRNAADNDWVVVSRLANWALPSVQSQAATAFTTAGTNTAYTVTTVPAAGSLATDQRYQFDFHTASGLNPTLARDGLTAKNLKIYNNAGAKIAPPTGSLLGKMDVVYDGTDQVVLNPLRPFQSVRAHTPNGYGSTNTNIRRFTTVATNEGTDITYADSATLGASFTINADGIYAVSYTEQFTGPAWFGPTLNATTALNATAAADVLAAGYTTSVANTGQSAPWIGRLSAGDVVRPATDGVAAGVSGYNTMTVARVA